MRRSALIYAALAAPRIARIAWPQVAFSDPAYLDAAVRVSRGQHPYRDFVHPQTPLPEYVIGGLERLLGTTSHRVPEVLTALLVFGASLLLLRVGSERVGRPAAIVAALLWAWHPFLLLLHVSAREVWVIFFSLLCALPLPPAAIALAAAAGFAAKPTFVVFLLPLAVARPRAAMWAALGGGLACALLLLCFGRSFLIQVFAFHLLKGRTQDAVTYAKVVWQHLPLLLITAMAGLWVVRRDRLIGPWLLVSTGFFVLQSPTIWEHNLVEVIPAAALATGALGVDLYRRSRIALAGALVCLGAVAALLVPRHAPEYWTGISGMRRADLATVVAQVRRYAPADKPIIAPLEIAAEADRPMVVHYPEVEGLMMWADEAKREGRLLELTARTRRLGYVQLCEEARRFWTPRVERSLTERKVPVVVVDDSIQSPVARLHIVRIGQAALARHGFRLASSLGHYRIYALGVATGSADARR